MLDAAAWHQAEHLVRGLISDIIEPFGVSADVTYVRGVPPVVNDFRATEVLRQAVTQAVGPSAVATTSQSLGGEDFAWYVEAVPGPWDASAPARPTVRRTTSTRAICASTSARSRSAPRSSRPLQSPEQQPQHAFSITNRYQPAQYR